MVLSGSPEEYYKRQCVFEEISNQYRINSPICFCFYLTAGNMANTVAHKITISTVKKPVGVLS